MPPDKCFGSDERDSLESRRKHAKQPDEEEAVAVSKPNAAQQLSPEYNQLLP